MRTALLVGLLLGACSGTGEPVRPSGTARDPAVPPIIVEVDAGSFHTCVRLDDGTVECWGQCGRQCGVRPAESTERIAVAGMTNAVELAVADAHTCARLSDGDVACWGSNDRNLLGRLEPGESAMPLTVPDVHDAVEIAIGGDLRCARLKDGGVMCWGPSRPDNEQTHEAALARLPKRVEGLTDAQSIAVTGWGACARTGVDARKCWSWGSTAPDWTPRMSPAVPDARKTGIVQSTDGVCACDLGIDGVVHCVGSGIRSAGWRPQPKMGVDRRRKLSRRATTFGRSRSAHSWPTAARRPCSCTAAPPTSSPACARSRVSVAPPPFYPPEATSSEGCGCSGAGA